MSHSSPNWHGTFIAGAERHTEAGRPAPYFRTEFDVDPGFVAARLSITAIGLVEAHLNGVVVGDEVLCPGWTSYDHRTVVSEHDVVDLIRPGRNALGAIAGEGWAVGRIGPFTQRNVWADRPAVFAQLEIDYADHTEVVATDGTWRTATGAVLADGIYDGDTIDARLEPVGWNRPGFDDAQWVAAQTVERNLDTLEPRSAAPIRRVEELAPVSITDLDDGSVLVDFGQVLTGWVRLQATGPAGRTITVRHTEYAADGVPDYEPNRTARATDRHTLRGDGLEVCEPKFTFHGFRYAVIDGWPGQLSPHQVSAVVLQSEMTRTGWFECSDDRVNQFHRNVVWSWRGNSVGLPTDCPQRDERLGWTGDINAFASTAAYLYDVADFLTSWLDDVVAEQADDGGIPVVVPDVLRSFSGFTALWGDAIVSVPWTLYQQYGDEDILRRTFPAMTRFLDAVDADLDERGLWSRGFQFGDWVDPDAPADKPSKGKTEPTLMAMAYLARTTSEVANAARVLGDDAAVARFTGMHERVRAAFRHEWVTPSGRLSNESQTAYALAICFDLLTEDEERRAGQRLVDLVVEAGYCIKTGFAGTPWVGHALSRTGHDDVAYRLLMQTRSPSFLYPVTMGATTIWERWDAVLADGTFNATGMTSLNHYALGAVADWLHRRVGGLRPVEPGYRTFEVAPQPGGGLTWARVVLDTRHGRIETNWRNRQGERVVELTVPSGTSARVVLPDHPAGLIEQVGPGAHRWAYPAPEVPPLGRETPLETLKEHPGLWAELYALFGTLMDGVPNLFDYVADEAPNLAAAVPRLPGVTDEFERRLDEVFAAANRGGANVVSAED